MIAVETKAVKSIISRLCENRDVGDNMFVENMIANGQMATQVVVKAEHLRAGSQAQISTQ